MLVYFLQKAKANNKSVSLRLAPPAFIIIPTKIPWTAMWYFLSYTSQLAIENSFAVSLGLRTPFREVIPGQTFKWNQFWGGEYFDLHSFVGKSKGSLLAVNNLQRDSTPRYTHISSVTKANLEKIWTTIWIFWISMAHIKAYFPTIRP